MSNNEYEQKNIDFLNQLTNQFGKIETLIVELLAMRQSKIENGSYNEKCELIFQSSLASLFDNLGRYYLILNNQEKSLEAYERKATKLKENLNKLRFEAGLGKRLRINKTAVRNMFNHLLTPNESKLHFDTNQTYDSDYEE